ncbi:hypothetical protein [Helicobacter colisuis]|uniref:Uncharacterized protein n=1 Tax=Helicobacter colisuis TaxID=2949739 RepID=A0ABT0TU06_9HELI|nr:hypothetical protein [Helicobacter colisuis]MCL9819269.1 hypothetical protein [Helicobacter colisuis]
MEEKYQILSALVVFHSLRQQGKDLFEILDSFIVFIICDKNLNNFTNTEIYECLKNEFEFDIPKAVIEQRLKVMVKNKKLQFDTNAKKFSNCIADSDTQYIKNELEKIIDKEKMLIEQLHASLDSGMLSDDKEKEILNKELINYFLGNTLNNYENDINKFIIKNMNNPLLNNISDGIIVYNALKYQDTFDSRKWEKLKIYINMEIIFHFMGYNGKFYNSIIDELFDLIVEINRSKKVIYLYYTSREEQRIENFFNALINNALINNKNIEEKDAAKTIRNRCGNDTLKIIEEKIRLFAKLKENTILKKEIDEVDFNLEKNQQFNIVSSDIKEKLPEVNDEKIEFLNKLNILRKNNEATIENSKYLFLTDENEYINISKYIKITSKSKIPIAIQVMYLTNILWLKLGKFSKSNNKLLIFKPEVRARISIALNLHNHETDLRNQLDKKIKEGMDKELAKEILVDLRSLDIKPEDIDEDNIVSLSNMSGVDLDYFIQQHNIKEEKINTMENKIEHLTNEVNEVNQDKSKLQKENEKLKQNNKSKDDEIKNYRSEKLKYEIKEFERNKKTLKIYKFLRISAIIVFFMLLCICSYFVVAQYKPLESAWNIIISIIFSFLSSILGGKMFFADKIKKYQEYSKQSEEKIKILQEEIKGANNA